MALMACAECGKQVSDAAMSCPSCGFPIAAALPGGPGDRPEKSKGISSGRTLFTQLDVLQLPIVAAALAVFFLAWVTGPLGVSMQAMEVWHGYVVLAGLFLSLFALATVVDKADRGFDWRPAFLRSKRLDDSVRGLVQRAKPHAAKLFFSGLIIWLIPIVVAMDDVMEEPRASPGIGMFVVFVSLGLHGTFMINRFPQLRHWSSARRNSPLPPPPPPSQQSLTGESGLKYRKVAICHNCRKPHRSEIRKVH